MKAFKLMAVLAATFLAVSACHKDDSTSSVKSSGSFTIQGVSYSTDTAGYVKQTGGSYALIALMNRDLASYPTFTAKDTLNYVMIYFPDTLTIRTGTFTYKDMEDESFDSAKNFIGGYMAQGYAWNGGNPTYSASVIDGTVTVTRNSDGSYKVSYDLTDSNKNEITGSYTGSLKKETVDL